MSYKIDFGALFLDVTKERVLVFPNGARDGQHLTVYLEPRQAGPHAGFFTPHITRPKARRRHDWLERFRPGEFEALLRAAQEELMRQFAGASKLVTLGALQKDAWMVTATNDELVQARAKDWFFADPHGFRFDGATQHKLWDLFALMVERGTQPVDLSEAKREAYFLVRVVGEKLEQGFLGYYPNGLYGPPGWYFTALLDFTDQIYRTVFMRQASAKLIRTLVRIAKFLGGDPPAELLEVLRQRDAERKQR
jgi:hypothetical protein